MLYCNRCGQCIYISEDSFVAYTNVSGTEKQWINPKTGDVDDSEGITDTDYGDSEYQCPHCNSSDIQFDVNEDDLSEEDAFARRARYEREHAETKRQALQASLARTIKDSEWDLNTNEVHK